MLFTITIARKAATLGEGGKGSLEQLVDKVISSDLFQQMFEEFGKKMVKKEAVVKKEVGEDFVGIKKDLKEIKTDLKDL